MPSTGQTFVVYVGKEYIQEWSYSDVDYSANTPTLAIHNSVGSDVTVTGIADLVGSDTIISVTIGASDTSSLVPGFYPFQLHLSSVGVVAEGDMELKDNFAD